MKLQGASIALLWLLTGVLYAVSAAGDSAPHGDMDVNNLPHPQTREIREKNADNLNQLTVGMSVEQMLKVMGTDNLLSPAKRFSNPYKRETYRVQAGKYEV